MKFDAAATAPGLANCSQKGTEPSAKSIQTGFFAGSEQASPVAALGAAGRAEAVRPATAASRTSSETLFTRRTLSSRKVGGATDAAPPLYVVTYPSSSGVSTSGISSASPSSLGGFSSP